MDAILSAAKTPVAFSASPYWQILRDFYQAQGLDAWDGKVPYYATNNTKMAMLYAQAIVAYYQDWVSEHGSIQQPLHIIELGSGSARFGFYLLKALEKVAKLHQISLQKFKLILSDFVQQNVQAWLDHPQFQPYFEQGVLDCMLFDSETTRSFYGLHSQLELLPSAPGIPPWVLGHYLFDSLPVDVFRVSAGQLSAVHVSLRQDDSKAGDHSIESIAFDKTLIPFQQAQYHDSQYNDLLQLAAREVGSGYFSFPIAAFELLKTLQELLPNGYVFSCLDKGFFDWSNYQGEQFPDVFYHHDTFSVDFNFCALLDYVQQKNNSELIFFTKRRLVKWAVFSHGFQLPMLKRSKVFGHLQLELADPAEQAQLLTYAAQADVPVSVLLGWLANSYWDPILLMRISSQLIAKMAKAPWDEQVYLFSSLSKVEKHYFQAVDSGDIYRVIGCLHHAVGEDQSAIGYFHRSEQLFGETYATQFALGKAYFSMGDSTSALRHFARAKKHKITKPLAAWLKHLRQPKSSG